MTGPARLSIATIREAIRKRVDETSLREVADEVGMSFSGLRSFLDGSSPQPGTREKLVRWHYSHATRSLTVPHDELETAIALVLSYLHDESKPRAVRERRLREVIDRLKGNSD
jgi:hypothetical protein